MVVQIKRIILLLWVFCFPVQVIFSQPYSSRSNYTGAWEEPDSWIPVWAVPQNNVNGHNITINGYITANVSLSFSGSSNLIINDTLVIKGDLSINDNNDLTVNDNGILIVRGNLTFSDESNIIANGYLIVTGGITKEGSTNDGSFTSNDNPVKVFIGGTISPTGLTNHKTNLPVLDCASPPTNPYPNSTCSYGNLTDIINDPIYLFFFQSTCTIATPTITAGGPTTFCAGGSVTLTSSAGTTYLWSTGETTASINATTAGNYTVRVTDPDGCQSSASDATVVTVNALPVTPTITAGGPTTFCAGGSVTLTSSAGTSYLWSTGAITASIIVTTAGSYTVQVTNASGCQSAASVATMVTVNALPLTPTITADGPTTICADGSVTLTSSAGTSYLWSNSATTSSINVITAGSYTVQVTDANGCQSAASAATVVTVNALPATPTITADGPTTFCAGGSVTLTSSAGTNYLWSNTATTSSINVITAGSYTVKVTDANGCQSAASVATVVTVNALPVTPTITADGPTTFCAGGSVTLTSSAGISYLWSTSATTESINVTTAGSYTVKVTDANGCQSAASVATVVTVNSLPVATITAGGPTTFCAGGSVILTSSAGKSYLWSNAAITPSINVTTAGSYTVQITDANGCQSEASAATVVNINALPVVNAGTDATIPNGTSTSIDATVTGIGPFIYSWSPPGQLADASIEDPTTVILSTTTVFTLTATSTTTSCSNTDAVTIIISGGPLSSTPTATPGTICAGANVQLNALAGGGSGSYTYTWTSAPAGFTSSIADPIVNPTVNTTYDVVVDDGFTTVNSQVVVTVNALPATPTITAGGPTTFCNGGSVTLTSSAGTSYLWSNAATTPGINITTAGSYTVQVINASGCQSAPSASTVVTVNAIPSTPTITAGGPTTFCAGGSVTLTSSAETSYLWSNAATTPDINVITTGSYTVKVTNASGCQSTESTPFVVTVNALPSIPTITDDGPTTFCNGSSVTLTSSAGSTYLWSNAETTASINVTTAGSYTVQVTDASGCQSAASAATVVTVNTLPSTPTISADGPTTFCNGGSVTLTSSAGTSYLWSNAATTPGINITAAGSYTVQVTNASGCQSVPSAPTVVTVNALPVTPTITAGGPTAFCTGGNVILTSSAGAGYLWSNAATTQGINITAAGSYSVQVTNANGCQSAASVATVVTVNALPVTPTITADGPTTICDGGSITLTSSEGYAYLWSNAETTPGMNVATAGSYTVKVTDASGCQSAASAATVVTVNALPATPTITAGGTITFCDGGSVTLTSSAGTSYLWSNAETTASINVTTAGSYNVQLIDASGCQSASSVATAVTVNALPVAITGNNGPVCTGSALNLTGGPADMTIYSWTGPNGFSSSLENPSVSPNVTLAMAGDYTLSVTDAYGCINTASTTVTVNALPVATASSDGMVCAGSSLGLTGGPAGMNTYSWTGPNGFTSSLQSPSISASATAVMAGDYTITVTDTSGCTGTAATTVIVNALPVATASSDSPVCAGVSLGLTGGPAEMNTYSWTGPNGFTSALQSPSISASATAAMAGVYTLTVTNAIGCADTVITAVVINSLPLVSITSSNTMCINDLRTLTGTPAGGTFVIVDGPGTVSGNVLTATGPGTVNIEYSYTNVCTNKTTQGIIVNENPVAVAGPDQELTFIFETELTAELPLSETGEWSLVSGSGQITDIHSPITMVTDLSIGENIFLWKVRNGNCEAGTEVKITVSDLFVPSVITPNGDGKNDYFKINALNIRTELIVFNRWGNVEYTNSNYQNDWDGRNDNGNDMTNDTYYYILKFENGLIKKGTVLITR